MAILSAMHANEADMLEGRLVNFRKLQRSTEMIEKMLRWQTKPYTFAGNVPLMAYPENVLGERIDSDSYSRRLWELSLQRQPHTGPQPLNNPLNLVPL